MPNSYAAYVNLPACRYTVGFGQQEIFLIDPSVNVKKLPTKADIRADLERKMNQFEKRGGEVNEIPTGLSGRDALDNSPPSRRLFLEPTVTRTQVPEVIAAIEARRKEKTKPKPINKPRKQNTRRRKTIYDDFGEPLRTVWVDE